MGSGELMQQAFNRMVPPTEPMQNPSAFLPPENELPPLPEGFDLDRNTDGSLLGTATNSATGEQLKLEESPQTPPQIQIPALPEGFELMDDPEGGKLPFAINRQSGEKLRLQPSDTSEDEGNWFYDALAEAKRLGEKYTLIDESVGLLTDPAIVNPLGRGSNRLQQAGALLAHEVGLIEPETAAKSIAQDEIDMAQYPRSQATIEGMQEWEDADGWWESAKAIATNPTALAAVVGESLVLSIPPILGGVVGATAGPLGIGTGAATGSFSVEYAASVTEAMKEQGVNLSKDKEVLTAFGNPEIMAAAREKGLKRGVPIAIMDGLSMGIAGRIMGPVSRAIGTGTSKVSRGVGAAAEVGAQALSGAAGEASAQLVDEGQISSPADVLVEGVAEIVTGAPEIVLGATQSNQGVSDTQKPGIAPDEAPEQDMGLSSEEAQVFSQELDAELQQTPQPETGLSDPGPENVEPETDSVQPAPPPSEEQILGDETTRAALVEILKDDTLVAAYAEKQGIPFWEARPQLEARVEAINTELSKKYETRQPEQPTALEKDAQFLNEVVSTPAQNEIPTDLPSPQIPDTQKIEALQSRQSTPVETAQEVEIAAERVNPEPSEAQKEAGNYKMGHIKVGGLDVTIETAKGAERTGPGWSVRSPAHYGYVKRSEGSDGDHVDVYVGDNPQSQEAFIVDQIDPKTGDFDEHKIIMGVNSQQEAKELYKAGFSDGKGASRMGAISSLGVENLKAWLKDGDTKSSYAFTKQVKRKYDKPRAVSAAEFVRGMGGIQDVTGELKAIDLHRTPGLVSDKGRHPDKVREALAEAGYFSGYSTNTEAVAETTVADLYDLMSGGGFDAFNREDQADLDAYNSTIEAEADIEQRIYDEYDKQGMEPPKKTVVAHIARLLGEGMEMLDAIEQAEITDYNRNPTYKKVADQLDHISDADFPGFTDAPENNTAEQADGSQVEQSRQGDQESKRTKRSSESRQAPPVDGERKLNQKELDIQGRKPGSWFIVRNSDGQTMFETFDEKKVDALNTAKYQAIPAGKYLGRLNKLIKEAGGDPSPEAMRSEFGRSEDIGPDNKPQKVIPGAEKVSDKVLAQRKADTPLKPKQDQKLADEGLFGDSQNQGLLFQLKAGTPDKPLIVQHNISEDGLRVADDLMGLPMPSIAVSRADYPLTNFGEITLIGDPEMATPSNKNKTFIGDAYTGRQPRGVPMFKNSDEFSKNIAKSELFGHAKNAEYWFSYYDDVEQLDRKIRIIEKAAQEGFDTKQFDDVNDMGSAASKFLDYKTGDTQGTKGVRQFAEVELMLPQGYTPSGNRKKPKPYNLENVMKEMKREGAGKKGAENFNYGPSSFRAKTLKQLSKRSEVTGARDRIQSEKDTKETFDAFSEKFSNLVGRIAENIEGNSFSNFDSVSEFMGDYITGKSREWSGVSWVDDLTPADYAEIDALAEEARNLPANYIEVKPNRLVGLEEFKRAVIPEKASEETRDILKRIGIQDVVTYTDEQDRIEKIRGSENFLFKIKGQTSTANLSSKAQAKWPEIEKAFKKIAGPGAKISLTESLPENSEAAFSPDQNIAYVASYAVDPMFSARHEAVHALRNMGKISNSQFRVLKRYVQDNHSAQLAATKERYKKVYRDKDSDIFVEEVIADLIAMGIPEKGRAQNIINRLAQFLEKIRNAMRGLGFHSAEGLLTDIESGKLAKRPPEIFKPWRSSDLYQITDETEKKMDSDIADIHAQAGWGLPEESQFDFSLRKNQDTWRRVKVLEQQVEEYMVDKGILKKGQFMPEDLSPYLAEQMAHGKIPNHLNQIKADYIDRINQSIADTGLEYDRVRDYVYAKHVPERNAQVLKTTGKANGSGKSDAWAAKVMKSFTPQERAKMDEVSKILTEAGDEKLRLLQETGFITSTAVNNMKNAYQNHVVLSQSMDDQVDMDFPKIGVSVKQQIRRATGMENAAEDPIMNTIAALSSAAVASEHNQINKKLFNLAKAFPNEDVFAVAEREPNHDRQNETGVFVDGKPFTVVFKDRLLARAFRNLRPEQEVDMLALFKWYQHIISGLLTRNNPSFLPVNLSRDAIMTGLHVMLREGDVVGGLRTTLRTFRHIKTAFQGDKNPLYKDFKDQGGNVSFVNMSEYYRSGEDIKKSVEEIQNGKNSSRKMLRSLMKYWEQTSNIFENSARVSYYEYYLSKGYSKSRAAQQARRLADFSKKGEWSSNINAVVLFYNAAIQGNSYIIENIYNNPKRGLKILAALATAQAMFTALNYIVSEDYDEDENSFAQITDYYKSRNIIIPIPGTDGHVFIPLPLGFSGIANMGRIAVEETMNSIYDRETKGIPTSIYNAVYELWATSTPADVGGTIFEPYFQHMRNENFFGGSITPLYPNEYKPKSEQGYTPRSFYDVLFDKAAKGLNLLGGGSDIEKGGHLDIYPQVLRHYFDNAIFPGVGTEIVRGAKGIEKLATGQETSLSDIPVLRRFGSGKNEYYGHNMYEMISRHYDPFKSYEKARKDGIKPSMTKRELREKYPVEARTFRYFEQVNKRVRKIRRQRSKLYKNKKLAISTRNERLRNLQEKIEAEYLNLIRKRREVRKAL